MKKKLLLLTIAVLCFGTFASADNLVLIGSRAYQNPTDIIDWTQLGPDIEFTGTTFTTPQLVFTFNGNPAFVGNFFGGDFARVDAGFSWTNSLFDYGESLVWTIAGGPFAIEFLGAPVGSIGFGIEPDAFGPYMSEILLYDSGMNLLGGFLLNGNSPMCGSNCYTGGEQFIGVGDTTGANIAFVLIATDSEDFTIDDPSLTYGAFVIPEPSSLVLLGSGLLGLAGVMRRKLGR